MKASVIITTYNSVDWLRKVLIGYSVQNETEFELVIADDGSTKETKELIASFSPKFNYPIIHVWHEDKGYRKTKILNSAIIKASADYLIFSDGDCIPRHDFIQKHLMHQQIGYFLSGGYFKLPLKSSTVIADDDIVSQKCFSIFWLLNKGVPISFKLSKLINNDFFVRIMNWATPTKRTFNGHNSSVYKQDLLAINGFNQNMHYGGLDREVGERLVHSGILSKQIRYHAICLHLHHERGYKDTDKIHSNLAIRRYNLQHKIVRIKNGIVSE
jgi:glycosyltransferase involved in cell wall biosynthesis